MNCGGTSCVCLGPKAMWDDPGTSALIRVRMGGADAHYGGGLVDGAKVMQFFGDVATELLIRRDGDEGLFLAYEEVVFTAPVYAGDYLEVTGRIVRVGATSRTMEFAAHKVIQGGTDPSRPSAARVVSPPLLIARAVGTCVVPKDRQADFQASGGVAKETPDG